MAEYEVKNYPYKIEIPINNGESKEIKIETPWIDDDKDIWEYIQAEKIFDEDDFKVVKIDYDNGFKVIFISTPDKLVYKTNWQLDDTGQGTLLPRIQ